ncbi:MAG: SIMPL domain-containing protein [Halobacteriota archaeon]
MAAKKIAIAIMLGGLLATAALTAGVGAQDSGAAQQNGEEDDRYVEVSGEAEMEAAPDLAVLHVAVENESDDADDARKATAEAMDDVREALAELGVDEDDMETSQFEIRRPRPTRDDERPDGHVAEHELRVETTDTDAVGGLLDAAVEAGATDVRGVSFELSDDRERELEDEALEAAMERARERAETIAGAGDVQVEQMRSASSTDSRVSPYRQEVAEEMDSGSSGTTISEGDVTASADVSVVYDVR